jgi:signal transduction histidine kinase/CheY-like chemotaxis protein/HPt (histidine-containing phosphotransfer) domain-containing protein
VRSEVARMISSEPGAQRPQLLDPQAALRAKRARRRQREVVAIPRLRAIGSVWLLLTVLAHNWLLLPELHATAIAVFGAAQFSYWLASSWLLKRYYRVDAPIDLGGVFLAADVIVFVSAIYVSGGERSWLLPLLCVRVADQMATSRRRVFAFATWTGVLHVSLVLYMAFVEQRGFKLHAELAKALFVYLLNVYLALAAEPSERQRKDAVRATAVAHDLIEELGTRTAQLEQARVRAETASQAKGTFLANISHELRTPMNAVLGTADLLLDEGLLPGQRSMVETILSAGRSLLSIVNDVLDMSKIEAGELKLQLSDVDLAQLVEAILSPLRVLALNKQLELRGVLEVDASPGVRADELRLRQVLFNLLGNAIKFTEAGSVTVHVTQTSESDERVRVRFSVEDTGIGMTEAAAREVFEPFKQADESTTRRFGGTGLGLSISRRLVQLMGGELALRTELGRGSSFAFELLLARAPLPAAAPSVATDTELAAKLHALAPHVLIAEDTEVNRILLQKWLERLGCRVSSVANGNQAVLALAREHDYALAFMDWHMPELDGLRATERIRHWELAQNRPRTPVIGFTASAFTDETERCRKAGMDDVLSKPLVRAELERALHRAVFADHTRLAPLPERGLETDDEVRLDRALLEELRSLGAPQYIASLLDQFMSDARERLEQLASAIESADPIKLRELAHALRGSAAGIGAKRLAALAARLEADSDGRMPADPRRRLLELREEYALLTAELAPLVTSAAASGF